eukprot:jgi/Astpho2/5851/Aster-x1326
MCARSDAMPARNRKRVAAVVTIGVASASAAYYVYSKWDELKKARAALWHLHDRQQMGAAPEVTMQNRSMELVEGRGNAHYDSVQQIVASTTTPNLLPRLAESLSRNTDYKPLLEALRAGGLSRQAKLDVWERIKALTFTRALAASWMVALLHLLNRVQLNILGRHLYLQNNTHDSQHPQHSILSHQEGDHFTMSGRAQELFLAHAHFCSDGGVQPLVPIVREAVLQALDGVDLATPVEASRILRVFSDAHATVAVRLSQQGFEQFLLPSPQQRNMWHSRSRLWPDDNVLQPEAPTPSSFDDDVVDALVTEVRQVITSPKFGAAVLVSVQEAAKVVAHELQQELGDAKLPMAKLCSRVGGLATRVLDKNNNECMRRFADLKEVQSLSATVYCCGPPL